jgi:NAD(P)-dependent dehydrogenase (short-subunit alcohol dehydrogenase family)
MPKADPAMSQWSAKDMPAQTGRQVVITGATGGLGFETALALAATGADVVLTGRNAEKGRLALAAIRARHPAATVRYEHLDLANLNSIAEFAERLNHDQGSLDLLVNNAGVMTPPNRERTADGFELQFGTNYLGHFALTARLMPSLLRRTAPRVVNLSSLAHRGGAIHFDDLQWLRRYKAWAAYGQSKLAMLMFAFELQRRSDAHGWHITSLAAHPGFARTDLIANGPGSSGLLASLGTLFKPLMSQSAADGALPILYAATALHAEAAGYYGPRGIYELKGPVAPALVARQAKDERAAAKLWRVSEQLTGLDFIACAGGKTE